MTGPTEFDPLHLLDRAQLADLDQEPDDTPTERVDCDCGRGTYDKPKHSSCYECYLDRRSEFESCIWCGRWHHPMFATCYLCRRITNRDEAGTALRQLIMLRDDYRCTRCGAKEGDLQPNPFGRPKIDRDTGDDIEPAPYFARLQVDHIKPCASGGTADEWNLQILCSVCNRIKGDTWFPGSRWEDMRTQLCRRYFLIAPTYFPPDELARFRADVARYRSTKAW